MKIFLSLLLVCNISLLSAQPSTNSIFEQTIAKIENLKSVSYTASSLNGNFFSKDDITKRTNKVSVLLKDRLIDYKLTKAFDDQNKPTYSKIYREGESYTFNIVDSTYTFDKSKEISYELTDFAKILKESLQKNPTKITRKADTIYQNIDCYSFLIKTYDTILNDQHDFTHKYILINKNNFLPVGLREKGAGTASKGGYVIGRITINNEEFYTKIKVNPKIIVRPISFKGFKLENSKMLSIGDDSPQLAVRTLSGGVVEESIFKNKILLVVFSSVDCAANPLANPVLNRLYARYKNANLAVLDIFTSETGEQVKKYIDANSLDFPLYLASRKQHSDFKIIGTPNFYIIGADRKIEAAIDGYSDKLENQLIKTIDKLLISTSEKNH